MLFDQNCHGWQCSEMSERRQPLKKFYNAAALDAIVLYVPGNANVLSFLLFMV